MLKVTHHIVHAVRIYYALNVEVTTMRLPEDVACLVAQGVKTLTLARPHLEKDEHTHDVALACVNECLSIVTKQWKWAIAESVRIGKKERGETW